MQKYALIKFLEKLDEGAEFPATNWPLHVTLASNFVVDWEGADLFNKLSALAARHKPIRVTAGNDEYFGPQKQTQVTVLHMNAELRALHNDIIALLRSTGAIFDEPHYLGEAYRAHATVHPHARLHKGDVVTIDEVTVVDMFPHGDISRRKLLRIINLRGA